MSLPVYIYVTPFFPSPTSWRGAYGYDFVKALMRTGKYDVKVFVPGSGEDYEYQGVQVYRFPVKYLPSAVLPFLFTRWNQQSFLRKVRKVGIDIKKVTVCHGNTAFYGIYPLALKKLNPRIQTLLHHHDPASFGLNLGRLRHVWIHKLINYVLLRRMHNAIDMHVFISDVVKKSFLSVPDAAWTVYEDYKRQMRGLGWLRGVNVKKSVVLHNGVDIRLFSPRERCQRQGGPIIGCVGNFTESKDQRLLLEAAVRLRGQFPELQLRFIGSGKTLAACQAYAYEHRLNAIFLKEVNHAELAEFYRDLDLFVLPSYWDGFGCVFTEAWASGVPFIASAQVGIVDLIPKEDRDIWIVPPRNSKMLADCILYVLTEQPKQNLCLPVAFSDTIPPFLKAITRGGGG